MLRGLNLARNLPLAASAAIILYSGTVLYSKRGSAFVHCAAIKPNPTNFGSYTYPANDPNEDRHLFHTDTSGWSYAAVFDGHGGWQVADLSSKNLLSIVIKKLSEPGVQLTNADQLDKKLIEAYQEMENKILDSIRQPFQMGFAEVAKVGSCSILALKKERQLLIVNCGDCRAILGSVNIHDPTKIYATIINRDHNCRELLEQIELKNKHPNEENLVVCKSSRACYVKGRLQLTRSLGDVYLKYPEFNGNPDKGRSGGRYIPAPYTPPYVSHIPDVHHLTLQPEDNFVILGSDGLWDDLTAEEAVKIVQEGLLKMKTENEIAITLVESALTNAARQSGMTLEELKKLPAGRARRSRHDDTTAVVMIF